MTGLLLALQLAVPITNAYAQQVKDSVIVSVTYTAERPIDVCVFVYELGDAELLHPADRHCWKPDNDIGDNHVWADTRLNMVNFKVSVKYPSGMVEAMLVWKVDT